MNNHVYEGEIPVDIYKRRGSTPSVSQSPSNFTGSNLPAKSIKAIKANLNDLYHDKSQGAMLLFGGAGIGKSDVVRQFAESCAARENRKFTHIADLSSEARDTIVSNPEGFYVFLDLRAGLLNPEQSSGIPDIEKGKKKGFLEFLPPEWIAIITNKEFHGLIFLDELNRGNESVINSLFQFVLDRVANNRRISPHATIVAAANLGAAGDFSGTSILDSAMMSRFNVSVLVADPEEWASYARAAGVSRYIIDFALSNPDENFHGNVKDVKDHNIPINPRNLVAASRAMQLVEKAYVDEAQNGKELPENYTGNIYQDIQNAIEGRVGTTWVNKFIEWLGIVHKFDWVDILNSAKAGEYKSKSGKNDSLSDSQKWALTNYITNEVIIRYDRARKANNEAEKKRLVQELHDILSGINLDNVSFILNNLAISIRDNKTPGVTQVQAATDFAYLIGGIANLAKSGNPAFYQILVKLTKEMAKTNK